MMDDSASPIVSVVVCTYNRKKILDDCLNSLTRQSCPDSKFEVLVVDNGSTDYTNLLVQSKYRQFQNIHYLHEPVIGLSQARNTGWRQARGQYVAFIDDDAQADMDWVESIIHCFESLSPRPGAIGGKTDAKWEEEPPKWLADSVELQRSLSIRDGGDVVMRCMPQDIWGVNCAYMKKLLEEMGGFDTRLGRVGNALFSSEEKLLNLKIAAAGYHLYYTPQMCVQHFIPKSRLTRWWFIKRQFFYGMSDTCMSKIGPVSALPHRPGKPFIQRMILCWPFPSRYAISAATLAGRIYGKWRYRKEGTYIT
jgi:glycosyltransferase involved in cell wall biosynthesis